MKHYFKNLYRGLLVELKCIDGLIARKKAEEVVGYPCIRITEREYNLILSRLKNSRLRLEKRGVFKGVKQENRTVRNSY